MSNGIRNCKSQSWIFSTHTSSIIPKCDENVCDILIITNKFLNIVVIISYPFKIWLLKAEKLDEL